MMNSKHLFSMSIVAAGLIWGGGHALASDSGKGMAPSGDMNSGSANSGVFSGVPDPNSPGGTKDDGKGSTGTTEIGNVGRGNETNSGGSEPTGSRAVKPSGHASSSTSASGGASAGSSTRMGSGNASDEMKAAQVGERKDDKGMKDGESQTAKVIKGEVLRIEGENYFVKGQDGQEVRVHIDQTTKMSDKKLDQGELIEATVNEQNHVLSIQSPDRRSDHTLESGQAVERR